MSVNSQNHRKGLSGGVRFGVPPKRGPNPQGINVPLRKVLYLNNGKKKNKIS